MQKSNNTRELIIFGDSLSDNGNIFHIVSTSSCFLSGIHMTSPPSVHDGRVFCNGELLIEHIARHLGYRCDPAWKRGGGNNYAVSYASIFVKHRDYFLTPLFPGLDFDRYSLGRQIDNYIQRADKAQVTDPVFFFIIGSNDVILSTQKEGLTLAQKKAEMQAAAAEMVRCMEVLKAQHPQSYFVIIGSPDLGDIPAFYATTLQHEATALSAELQDRVLALITARFAEHEVLYIEIQQKIKAILAADWGDLPAAERYMAPLDNIANRYVDIVSLIQRRELKSRFINEASQEAMDNGRYPFYDHFHGSAKLHLALFLQIEKTLTDFLSSVDNS